MTRAVDIKTGAVVGQMVGHVAPMIDMTGQVAKGAPTDPHVCLFARDEYIVVPRSSIRLERGTA